jgi:hypothetical protein
MVVHSFIAFIVRISVLLSLLLSPAVAFFPWDHRETLGGGGGISHQSQTKAAFAATALEFFGISELSSSMEHA